MSISSLFRQASQLQERIEASRAKLEQVLETLHTEVANMPESVSINDLLSQTLPSKNRKGSRSTNSKTSSNKTGNHSSKTSSNKAVSSTKGSSATSKTRLQAVKSSVQKGAKGSTTLTSKNSKKSSKSTSTKGSILAHSPLKGKKRPASPSGPLAPAVVEVLRNESKPMTVRSIYEALEESGYQFTTPEPKKNLAARIYRLSGVKQVGEGLFSA